MKVVSSSNNSYQFSSSNTLISVIVPVYNGEKYIDDCLFSIIKQTYTNIEIILVNDASTDDTYMKLLEYKSRDERIKIINLDVNSGVSYARNMGVMASKGDWICFIDVDDYIKPYYIESFIKRIKPNIYVYCIESFDGVIKVNRWISGLLKNELAWFVHHKMYCKSLLLENNVLDVPKHINIGEDLIINLRLSRFIKGNVCIINSDAYIYRENMESVSKSRNFSLCYEEMFMQEVEKSLYGRLLSFHNEIWLFKFKIWKNLVEHRVYVNSKRIWIKSLLANKPNIKLGLGDRYLLVVKNYYFAYVGLKIISFVKGVWIRYQLCIRRKS